ncbi:Aldehyde ferredoxin oxidoreductase, domains 2 & 3 [anaerobic digester metagenome]
MGDILDDGTKAAAKRIGKNSEKFAVNAGGQEPAMHDPKWEPGLGLSYSVEPTPGRHTIGSYLNYELYNIGSVVKGYPILPASYPAEEKYHANENNVMMILGCSLLTQIINSCGICMFATMMGINRYPIFQYINASNGWDKTPETSYEKSSIK